MTGTSSSLHPARPMTGITIRILDGADRGRVFDDLLPPITIGREEGNTIQLNDERVSRFHVKIQEDQEKIILTDLESTNGTKVNGEEIRLRLLRYGDLVSVGRTLLLFGSEEQIAARLAQLRNQQVPKGKTLAPGEAGSPFVATGIFFHSAGSNPGASSWLSDSGSTSSTASFGVTSFSATRSVAMTTAA